MRLENGNLLVGATSTADVSNLTLGHLLEGNSASAGSGAVGTYNNSGTAKLPFFSCFKQGCKYRCNKCFCQILCRRNRCRELLQWAVLLGMGHLMFSLQLYQILEKKENIKSISGSLDKINSLNPVEFDWKKTGEHIKSGFIAQEVEKIFPEYIVENISNEGEEERKGLTGGMTSGIVPHLVKAIQELKAEIELLKNK